MTYKALVYFEDIQDGRHPYNAGDEFPRPGYTPSEQRIAELSSTNNKRGKAVIIGIQDDVEVASVVTVAENTTVEPVMNEPVEDAYNEPVKQKRGRKRKGE